MAGTAEGQFVTNDLSLAAYLAEFGLVLKKADRSRGTWEFVFDDREGRAAQLSVDWSNSCCRRFESRIRSLKSLLYSGRGSGPGNGHEGA
jgi:hypothetical protein